MKSEVLVVTMLLALTAPAVADPTSAHQDMIMTRGSQVMPFDQKVAMHMFTPSSSGGTVEVMVHNMDSHQIALVRAHLSMEAKEFAAGNYSDPAYIHGQKMPGLEAMAANAKAIAVRYSDTPMGGKIVFSSTSAASVTAIHRWLAAQSADHGSADTKHCDMGMP